MSDDHGSGYRTVRIPADVARSDEVLGRLTARQAAILGGTAVGLWVVWSASRSWLPPVLFLPPAVLVLLLVAVAVSVVRDGVSLDRFLLSAVRQAVAPRRQALAPEGVHPAPGFLTAELSGRREKPPVPLDLPVEVSTAPVS